MTLKIKSLLFIVLTIPGIALSAQTSTGQPPTTSSEPIPWASNDSSDKVKVENGNGANLNIIINVNDDSTKVPAGINVINCGNTTHIDAGSTAICVTNDAKNPVTFNSDQEYPATGTYQINQQLPIK